MATAITAGVLKGDMATIKAATFYNSTGDQVISNSYTELTLNATLTNTDTSVFTLADNEVTIASTGVYHIDFSMGAHLNSGTRDCLHGRLERDSGSGFGAVSGTFIGSYTRIANENTSASGAVVLSCTVGDKLRITAQGTANNTMATVVEGTRLTLMKIG